MNYEQEFLKQYKDLSNSSSQYYKFGYQRLLDSLNSATPTLNTLTGSNMAGGGSYKGSRVIAGKQRQAAQTAINEGARKGFLDMYMNSQGMAQQALQGASQAYQYEDSKPSFWEEVGGYALGGLTQAVMPGVGGFLSNAVSGLFTGGESPSGGSSLAGMKPTQAPVDQNYSLPKYGIMGDWQYKPDPSMAKGIDFPQTNAPKQLKPFTPNTPAGYRTFWGQN